MFNIKLIVKWIYEAVIMPVIVTLGVYKLRCLKASSRIIVTDIAIFPTCLFAQNFAQLSSTMM